jgi:hypothetical protein
MLAAWFHSLAPQLAERAVAQRLAEVVPRWMLHPELAGSRRRLARGSFAKLWRRTRRCLAACKVCPSAAAATVCADAHWLAELDLRLQIQSEHEERAVAQRVAKWLAEPDLWLCVQPELEERAVVSGLRIAEFVLRRLRHPEPAEFAVAH